MIAGESLWTIAAHYATTTQAIASANHLSNPNVIPVGLSLDIPGGVAPAPVLVTHLVVAGENLSGIAARYGVTVQALVTLNSIANPNVIPSGTVLRIGTTTQQPSPGTGSTPRPVAPVPPPAPATTQHVVAAGETLSGIASSYGVSVATLISVNQLTNADFLAAGQSLTIPVPQPSGGVGALLVHFAQVYRVNPALVEGLAWQESGWQQRVVSDVDAMGVMQLLPGTASFVGMYLVGQPIDPTKLTDNIQAGVAFLSYLLKQTGGNTAQAVAGYYQGLASVRARGMYKDTKRYVADVLALEQHFAAT
ncbi:MAG: LysM peptidoglycan-binding domain-containing protein [Actinomycetota bacterium]